MTSVLLNINSIMLFLFTEFQKILEELLLEDIKKIDGFENITEKDHLIYDFHFRDMKVTAI